MRAINNKIKTLYNITCKTKGAIYSYNENTGSLQTISKHIIEHCSQLEPIAGE